LFSVDAFGGVGVEAFGDDFLGVCGNVLPFLSLEGLVAFFDLD
jgi:hypothetical protein